MYKFNIKLENELVGTSVRALLNKSISTFVHQRTEGEGTCLIVTLICVLRDPTLIKNAVRFYQGNIRDLFQKNQFYILYLH